MKNPSHYPSPAFSLIVFAFLMFAGGTLASAQRYKVLYTFKGGSDGFGAGAAVIFDKEGALYSTAGGGNGTPCSCGVVFKLAPPTSPGGARTETVLYAFNGGVDGGEPVGSLIFRNGELFGTASRGGVHNAGVVFKLTPPATGGVMWTETVLYSFKGGTDGSDPSGNVIFDNAGALYGTTPGGGQSGVGTVFKLTPEDDEWTESVLYSFQGGTDGGFPSGSVIFDQAGSLYGTAGQGGAQDCVPLGDFLLGCGTVFKLTPPSTPGAAWTETVLYSFQGGADGCNPGGGLVFGPTGVLYGTAFLGGASPCTNPDEPGGGVAFALTPSSGGGNWTETVLFTFIQTSGIEPEAGLTIDNAGNLYGTTSTQGRFGECCGTVFKLSPTPGGLFTETTLHSFGLPGDGAAPTAPVALRGGRLYGTAEVVFSVVK